jgi:hypothetical protein
VAPFCQRIVETPVMMILAQADNITSADLEAEMPSRTRSNAAPASRRA